MPVMDSMLLDLQTKLCMCNFVHFNLFLNVLCLVSMALWRQERVIAVKVYYINPL